MQLRPELESRLQEEAPPELDLVLALRVADESPIQVAIKNGKAGFPPSAEQADATFCFDTAETAAAILYGDGDFVTAFMEAFMAGKVRSDGHLPLTFILLGLFRPGLRMQRPD